jgi:hypothetical protein
MLILFFFFLIWLDELPASSVVISELRLLIHSASPFDRNLGLFFLPAGDPAASQGRLAAL